MNDCRSPFKAIAQMGIKSLFYIAVFELISISVTILNGEQLRVSFCIKNLKREIEIILKVL